jgi:hypothetical protein
MNPEIIVPISILMFVGFVIRTLINYQQNKQTSWQQSLQLAMQKQLDIDEASLRRLSLAVDPQRRDLRKAILFFVIASFLFAIAMLAPFSDPNGRKVVTVIALLPLGFSVTYLAFWKFWYR